MKLKRPLPSNRSFAQIKNHYLVEKALAEKLKQSGREERKRIYATMYDELFAQVPDHPRLKRRDNKSFILIANKSKFQIVKEFINTSTIFAEFGSGDCKFATEIAKYTKYTFSIDISDQRDQSGNIPNNFKLIVYDGYNLNLEDNSIDVVFSDQVIEHIHPEDTKLHFQLAYRILKKEGLYIFRTPHLFTGPHDISKYFSYKPEGFHLKEWTYGELIKILRKLKYSKFHGFWYKRGIKIKLPLFYFLLSEKVVGLIPKQYRRFVSKFFLPEICLAAFK